MSLMIKGMDMPKDYQQHNIDLFNTADGFWADEYRFENNESKYKTRLLHSVVEIPTPHGRLIDADALLSRLNGIKYAANVEDWISRKPIFADGLEEEIISAPTIIEAEE